MIKIIIVNQTKEKVPVSLKRVAEIAAAQVRRLRGAVEVNLIADKYMRQLNRQYRGLDRTTDVLSFAWEEEIKMPGNDLLGQIYISLPQIKRQAREYSVSVRAEFVRMTVHGLLHLVGYDHMNTKDEHKMFALQEKIINNFFV